MDADDLLTAVAGATEFDSVSARSDEEDAVHAVLGDVSTTASTPAAKGARHPPREHDRDDADELRSDAWVIKQNALRLLAAIREFVDTLRPARCANLACGSRPASNTASAPTLSG